MFYRDDKLAAILNNSSEMNSLGGDDSSEDEPFEANLINSTVYIIAMSLQVSTFAINYRVSCIFHRIVNNVFNMIINNKYINYTISCQGQPFMESLVQNKALLFSLVGNSAVILLLACGFLPNLAVQFEIVDFPTHVSF